MSSKAPTISQGTTDPAPILHPDRIYYAGDRFICGTTRCAGATAVYTNRTSGNTPVTPITPTDVAEWATYGLGPLRCECRALEATPIADDNGGVHTKAATR